MNKRTCLLAMAMIFTLFSCGGSKEDKESKKSETEAEAEEEAETEELKSEEKFANCDDFLKKYEEWMDAYLEVLEAVMTGSVEEGLEEKYADMGWEIRNWYTRWFNFADCAMDDEYHKKFLEIHQKSTAKLDELRKDFE